MKKANKPNKTAAIRAALDKNPNVSPSDLAQRLTKRGVKVSAAYVSTIKHNLKRRGDTPGNGHHAPRKLDDKILLSELMQAKKLVDQLGGVDRVRSMLTALEQLR